MRARSRSLSLQSRVDADLRLHLEHSTAPPNASTLLEIARIALFESVQDFHDVFFTLVSIITSQQLSASSTGAPAGHVRVAEAVLSLLFASDATLLCQISAKVLAAPPAFASHQARHTYYRHEIQALAAICRATRSEASSRDSNSERVHHERAFQELYLPALAQWIDAQVSSSGESDVRRGIDQVSKALASHQVAESAEIHDLLTDARRKCQALASQPSSARESPTLCHDVLLLMLMSYAIACSCLCIESVHIDIVHVAALAHWQQEPNAVASMRNEQLMAFTSLRQLPNASATVTAWSMDTALHFARATNTVGVLVSFCAASKSPRAHACLQEICSALSKHQQSLSKPRMLPERADAPHKRVSIHLQLCERYLGEMAALLREVPLVLELQCGTDGTDALTSDVLGSTKDAVMHGFEAFLKLMRREEFSGESTSGDGHEDASSAGASRFWTHASRERRVRARCVALKTRIVWHLKQLALCRGDREGQRLNETFERLFLLDFLHGRSGRSADDAKLVTKFLARAQDAVSCDLWTHKRLVFSASHQLQLGLHQQSQSVSYQLDKIVRTLALVTWAMWVRERCAYCIRATELLKAHNRLHCSSTRVTETERMRLGSLAATCALQLNVLSVFIARPDDVFALQIALLEDAAWLNRAKAVAVVCWAFPADKIQARYLKRYKTLRQALRASEQDAVAPIEETEQRCQFLQRHVKRSIRLSIAGGSIAPTSASYLESPKKHEMARSWTTEIDVLVDCCCDAAFQQTAWALIQTSCAAVTTARTREASLTSSTNNVGSGTQQLKRALLQSRTSQGDGAISRQEVLTLLQAQKREFEERARSMSRAADARDSEAAPARDDRPVHVRPPVLPQHSESTAAIETPAQRPSGGANRAALFTIRDIDVSTSDSKKRARDALTQKRKQVQDPSERHESVQNVLKLLSLRKTHGNVSVRPGSSPDLLSSSAACRLQQQQQQSQPSDEPDASAERVWSPKRQARDADVRRAVSFAPVGASATDRSASGLRAKPVSAGAVQPLVFPLRRAGDDSSASLQLLDRKRGGRSISLKPKQFAFERIATAPASAAQPAQSSSASLSDAVALRSTAAQTTEAPAGESVDQAPRSGVALSAKSASETSEAATQAHLSCPDTHEVSTQSIRSIAPSQSSSHDANNARPPAASVLSKFPVYVELDPSASAPSGPPKRFLQVVRFADQAVSERSVPVGRSSRSNIMASAEVHEPPERKEPQSIPQGAADAPDRQDAHSSTDALVSALPLKRNTLSDSSQNSALAAHRARYQSHFAGSNPRVRPERAASVSTGHNSLLSLRDDMERLKTRLAQLEHCANEIDEDFKDSHHVRRLVL